MTILDGQKLADQILLNLKTKIDSHQKKSHLAIILPGNNPASSKYVSIKQKIADKIGIKTSLYHLSTNTSQAKIIDLIKSLNQNRDINGILVQLPLPGHFNTNAIVNTIDPKKDVDGLTCQNLGRLFQSDETVPISASALAVIKLLQKYQINLKGKHVVLINNTPLVGLPLTALFNNRQATVSLCHEHTKNLANITKTADILVSAVGIRHYITANMIKHKAVVIGLGLSIDKDNKITGDLDFKNLSAKASFITPNFGGIGPVTIACLFQNLQSLLN